MIQVKYILAQTKKGNLVNWTVALINNSTAKPDEEFSFNGLSEKVGLVHRTNIIHDPMDYEVTKFNITDLKHETIELSEVYPSEENRLEGMLERTEEEEDDDLEVSCYVISMDC